MEGGEGGQSRRVVERDVYNTQYTSKATTVRSFLSSFRNAFDLRFKRITQEAIYLEPLAFTYFVKARAVFIAHCFLFPVPFAFVWAPNSSW